MTNERKAEMTRFDTAPDNRLESAARAILSHVEAAAEREGLPIPAEAQALARILTEKDLERVSQFKCWAEIEVQSKRVFRD